MEGGGNWVILSDFGIKFGEILKIVSKKFAYVKKKLKIYIGKAMLCQRVNYRDLLTILLTTNLLKDISV